jgi:nicotinamide mononucleotide transporter
VTSIEIAATLFGVACVYLTVRQNIWCWPTGIVMAALYVVIFHDTRLYSDMGLQVVYLFLQFYGWHQWLHGGADHSPITISRLPRNQIVAWGGIALVTTGGLGYAMVTYTDASLPFPDATTTVLSLIAQYFLSKKILESWVLWVAVDILSIGIYSAKELYLTAGLYTLFLGLATLGYFEWKKRLGEGTLAPALGEEGA